MDTDNIIIAYCVKSKWIYVFKEVTKIIYYSYRARDRNVMFLANAEDYNIKNR